MVCFSSFACLAAADGTGFVSEAPVPAGWPLPGEPEAIEQVQLPAYRAVEGPAFSALFAHISVAGIPMTAPVTMDADADPEGGKGPMRFLYPSSQTAPGPQGGALHVVDVPAQTVLRVAWRGAATPSDITHRIDRLRATARERGLETCGEPVVCGYNSPLLARERRTWEIILPVRTDLPRPESGKP